MRTFAKLQSLFDFFNKCPICFEPLSVNGKTLPDQNIFLKKINHYKYTINTLTNEILLEDPLERSVSELVPSIYIDLYCNHKIKCEPDIYSFSEYACEADLILDKNNTKVVSIKVFKEIYHLQDPNDLTKSYKILISPYKNKDIKVGVSITPHYKFTEIDYDIFQNLEYDSREELLDNIKAMLVLS